MIVCQLDSKTKQLAVAQSGFGVLYSPFLALGMAFLLGFRSSACPVWGGRSWLQTPSNGSVIRLGQGLVSRCRARHFCRVDHTSQPVITLVRGGNQRVSLSDYSFIFSCLQIFIAPLALFGLINALWGAGRLFACRRAARCNEPFRIPLYEQLRDCRSQSLYWVSYL